MQIKHMQYQNGAMVHRVERERVITRPEPNLRSTTDKSAAA
jgi:hypothetical protein